MEEVKPSLPASLPKGWCPRTRYDEALRKYAKGPPPLLVFSPTANKVGYLGLLLTGVEILRRRFRAGFIII